jgi:serine/threonine-protein kinase
VPDNRTEFTFHVCLGKGGFGEVYLATVRRSGGLASKQAVKVLREGLDNADEAVKRLQDEGRMLAILHHPCIVRSHDLYKIDGRIALATEYVEGMDLSSCCKPDRLLPPKVVVTALGEVADALDCAWNTISPETGNPLRLVHRDVKPENIRISTHGHAKLLDFGIARTSELARNARTRVGDLPFTPGYAAPESFRRGEQGPEADIYALGCTMYRLLVGERLFEDMEVGEQFAVAAQQEQYEPWLEGRLRKLKGRERDLIALLRLMVAWEKPDRPNAKQVREACEVLAEKLDGPLPAKWARTATFSPPRGVKGATLTGRTVLEDGAGPAVGRGATPPPPPPPPKAIGASIRPASISNEDFARLTPATPSDRPTPARGATPLPAGTPPRAPSGITPGTRPTSSPLKPVAPPGPSIPPPRASGEFRRPLMKPPDDEDSELTPTTTTTIRRARMGMIGLVLAAVFAAIAVVVAGAVTVIVVWGMA